MRASHLQAKTSEKKLSFVVDESIGAGKRGLACIARGLLFFLLLAPKLASSHGALAIGLPDSVARDGIAMGVAWNMPTAEAAQLQAHRRCADFDIAPVKTRALCKVIRTFRHQCVSIATDPEPGSDAWGWAVDQNVADAETKALRLCRPSALQFCVIAAAGCDIVP